MLSYQLTPVQEIKDSVLDNAGVRLLVKREDMNHPHVSGNKWWKLKYTLEEARRLGKRTLLTFGGAYSNHIYATAAAAKECGFKSIGVIRGEETLPLNPTLSFASICGMDFIYCSREKYREKEEQYFIRELQNTVGDFFLIPEGGSNAFAIKGVSEFAASLQVIQFDYLCVPVGTGGTLAGIIAGLNGRSNIIGFSSLKDGEFLTGPVEKFLCNFSSCDFKNWRIETAYHHGGYGKTSAELLQFIDQFEKNQGIMLDPVYTGKMMHGIFHEVMKGTFEKEATILAIHTGGLQGRKEVFNRSF